MWTQTADKESDTGQRWSLAGLVTSHHPKAGGYPCSGRHHGAATDEQPHIFRDYETDQISTRGGHLQSIPHIGFRKVITL